MKHYCDGNTCPLSLRFGNTTQKTINADLNHASYVGTSFESRAAAATAAACTQWTFHGIPNCTNAGPSGHDDQRDYGNGSWS